MGHRAHGCALEERCDQLRSELEAQGTARAKVFARRAAHEAETAETESWSDHLRSELEAGEAAWGRVEAALASAMHAADSRDRELCAEESQERALAAEVLVGE